ncbi:hypothetical protein [Synoicihabitans lomoniglobus]|uniref:Uncharacterized protein n=1 Tax=Synoicihabitans lomoniglobus TaxID=2909285 RepID=A0AAF0I2U5_9BACT|nr:hypothetical protein [Opitutaceae bacterium LMO-M01]WED65953.1 hypothetical protein PXH66_03705 [Opitutaceae bacterium LMO-M01]
MLAFIAAAEPQIVFADDFGAASRGGVGRNIIDQPPPTGLGYATNVHEGHALRKWIIADVEPAGPRRSFWTIPILEDGTVADYAEQAGRSRNSIAYVGTPLPADAAHYVIEFRQRAHDNDFIGFVLGASSPDLPHDGIEIAYQRQTPGTDDTVPHVHYRSPWGEGVILDRAYMRQWVQHRIEVRGDHVSWSQNGELMLEGPVATMPVGGWFGIRQSYERGTRYDDVRISLVP